jgi:hypothetical protein
MGRASARSTSTPHLVPFPVAIGSTVTVASAPGQSKLTVVGYASSIGLDEAAWVAPGQVAALRPPGAPAQQQMLYTFAQAGTASQVSADLAGLKHALSDVGKEGSAVGEAVADQGDRIYLAAESRRVTGRQFGQSPPARGWEGGEDHGAGEEADLASQSGHPEPPSSLLVSPIASSRAWSSSRMSASASSNSNARVRARRRAGRIGRAGRYHLPPALRGARLPLASGALRSSGSPGPSRLQ